MTSCLLKSLHWHPIELRHRKTKVLDWTKYEYLMIFTKVNTLIDDMRVPRIPSVCLAWKNRNVKMCVIVLHSCVIILFGMIKNF